MSANKKSTSTFNKKKPLPTAVDDETSLQEYQAILAAAEEVAQIGSWRWDLRTQKVTWSDEMFRIFGVERQGFDGDVNRVVAERIHPEDAAAVAESNRRVLEEAQPIPLSYRIVLPNGTEKTVWAQGKLVCDNEGNPLTLTGFVQDITERVRAEKKLLQMKRLYATLSQVNQMIVRVKEPQELYPTICNVAAQFGEFSFAWVGIVDEETGDLQPVAAHGQDLNHWPFPILNLNSTSGKSTVAGNALHTSKVTSSQDVQTDPRFAPVHNIIASLPYHAVAAIPFRRREKVIGVFILFSEEIGLFDEADELSLLEEMSLDISFALDIMENEKERRQSEEALIQSEERYRLISENSADVIWILDPFAGTFKYVSPSVEKLRGYTPAEVMAQPTSAALTPESLKVVSEGLARNLPIMMAKGSGTLTNTTEVDQPHKDGSIVNTEVTTTFAFNPQGQVEVIGISRDITERKKVEAALRASEAAYQGYFNMGTVGVCVTSPGKGWLAVNDRLCSMLGYSREELQKMTWAEITHPDDLTSDIELFEQVIAGERDSYELEKRFLHKSGEIISTLLYVNCQRDDKGTVRYFLASLLDITQRKKAEETLQESQLRFSKIFHSSPTGINIFKLKGGSSVDVNDAFLEIVGYSREEVLDHTAAELNLFVDVEARNGWMRKLAAGEPVRNQDAKIRRKTGEIRDALASLDLIEIDGETMVLVITTDITERRKAELALSHSHDLMRYIIEHNRSAVAVHDRDMRYVYVSQRYLEEYHIQEDVIGRSHYEIFPDLPQKWHDVHQRVLKGEVLSADDDIFERSDGSVEWTRWECRPWFEADGSIGGLIVYTEVITERKKIENALRKNEALLSEAQQLGHLGHWEWTPPGDGLICSDELFRIFEKPCNASSTLSQREIAAMLSPEEQKRIGTLDREAFANRSNIDYEFRVQLPSGERWLHQHIHVTYNENGERVRMLGIVQDVTERKQAETTLQKYNQQLTAIVQVEHAIALSLDQELIIQSLHAGIQRLFPDIVAFYISAYDQERQMIKAIYGSLDGKRIDTTSLPELPLAQNGEGTQSRVIRSREPLIINSGLEKKLTRKVAISSGKEDEQFTRSALYVPMLAQNKVLGLIQLQSLEEERFTKDDVRTLSLLANAAATAIQNARLYETAQKEITERQQAEVALRRSEHVLRLFVEHSPASIAMFDTEMRYIVASRRYLADYGLPLQDLTGRSHYDVFPEIPDRWKEIHRRCLAGATERAEDDPFPRLDGRLDWVRWEIRPWYETPEKIGGVILFSEVITESKEAQIALHQSEERHRLISSMISDYVYSGVVMPDNTTKTEWVSGAIEQITGYSLEELNQLPDGFTSLILSEDIQQFLTEQPELFQNKPKSVEYRIRRKDGEIRWLLDYIRYIPREDGPNARMIGAVQDITTRKQAEEELRQLNARLEQRVAERTAELYQANLELEHANRAKDEFLATMSHELRTPLNSIMGMSETLLEQRRGALNEYQEKLLQIISSSGTHLLELINDILDLSKIEAGKFDYSPQPISIEEVCRSSINFIRSQATRKSINITFENRSAVPFIYADLRRLKQILVNLLSNAVKFTPNGGEVSVQVSSSVENDAIQFSVIDTGIGIAAKDLPRLFQPFVQLDSSLNRQYEGTGLGLALVQRLTDLHGGNVQVESEVGKGSRFTITLPCTHEQTNRMTDPVAVISETIKAVDRSDDTPHQRGIVLLAEDNAPNILTIGDYLQGHNYEVVVAHDGIEAIQKTRETHPDIILMDIQMPNMDGLEAIRQLRADPRFRTTPIIALTALAMPGDRERCLSAGANEYMSKPVSLKELLEKVTGLLEPRRS